MNVLQIWNIYRRAQKLAGFLEEAHVSKHLFASKTFWFNVLTAAAELSQVLPLPPGYLTIAATVINIGLRFVTDKPVHVLPL